MHRLGVMHELCLAECQEGDREVGWDCIIPRSSRLLLCILCGTVRHKGYGKGLGVGLCKI